MRITCPACHAESSLEVLIGREADARAVAGLMERHLVLGDALIRYVALFRPEKRRLGLGRMVSLVEELMPDIERQAVARKGRDWPAPHAIWRAAIEQVLANRVKGSITLPLTSHGYLYEVIVGLADKAEAQTERQHESDARTRGHASGTAGGPVSVGTAVTVAITATPPPSYAAGPSRAAREIKAQIARAQAARSGMPSTSDDGGPAP